RLAFFFQADDGIRDFHVTGVQTCALPILVAVGLILAWNQPWLPFTPYDTWLILLLAYACLLLPYPARYAHAALRQIGHNLEAGEIGRASCRERAYRSRASGVTNEKHEYVH